MSAFETAIHGKVTGCMAVFVYRKKFLQNDFPSCRNVL